jgi:hypothetical protein
VGRPIRVPKLAVRVAPAAVAPDGEGDGFTRLDRPRSPRKRPDLQPLILILSAKVGVLLVIALAYAFLPFFADNFGINFVDPAYRDAGLARAFSTWDAQHYLYLSEEGYKAGQMSNAFFPLFPLLIHLLTPVFPSSLAAALVIANLASLAGFYLLYRFVEERWDRQIASYVLVVYLAFPTAFFFSVPYSESLFLLLIASFFLLLFRGRSGWAALPAALLPLARPEGALVILPFTAYYLAQTQPGRRLLTRLRLPLPPTLYPLSPLPFVLSPFAGIAAYLAFMKAATGNAFEMFNAMSDYISAHSLGYLLHPLQLLQLLAQWPLELHGFTDSVIDRLFFLGFLILILPMLRRVHPALAVYALAVGLLNVLSGTFMSYTRYILLAFPVFITLALLLRDRRLAVWRLPLLFFSTMVQALFLVMHALSYWVA